MKKTFSIMALVLTLASGQAQEVYKSVFIDGYNSYWTYIYQPGQATYSLALSYFKHYPSDTVVWDGLSYKYVRAVEWQHTYLDEYLDRPEYHPGLDYGLRESADHSRLYRRISEDDEDFLIMNLDWKVGDTVELWNQWLRQPNDAVVIDSIYYVDGRKYLRTTHYLKFSRYDPIPETYDTLIFIEGVGPTLGFMPFEAADFRVPMLSCYWHYNEDVDDFIHEYTRSFPPWEEVGLLMGCIPINVGVNSVNQAFIVSVSPNPTTGIIRVEGLIPGVSSVEVFDCLGLKMLTFPINSDCPELDISPLPSGVYLLRVNGPQASTVKIIKTI